MNDLLVRAAEIEASDLHIAVGDPPTARCDGELVALGDKTLTEADTEGFIRELLTDEQQGVLQAKGQVDLAYRLQGKSNFRINAFRYTKGYGLACRVIPDKIPTPEELHLPKSVQKVADFESGLVLVTGPTGCGKSTTIASIIDAINAKKRGHILTIEDPIEYMHQNNRCLITQREVGRDTLDFNEALRSGLRQDPDVIMVGEMRDLETIATAVTAAETGHLVLATLHTRNTYQTIERIIDVFPTHHQEQIRVQLANSLMAVFAQRLLPKKSGKGRIVSVESLLVTPAVRNLIRENKVHQLYSFIQTGHNIGMQTMDDYMLALYEKNVISRDVLMDHAVDKAAMSKAIRLKV